MNFRFTEDEEAFRQEVRDFLKKELPPNWVGYDFIRRNPGAEEEMNREIQSKLRAKGWLTLNWPKEYGGLGESSMKALILAEELAYNRVFSWSVGETWLGPVIIRHGTEEQKKKYLPGILSGEIDFALGYSEPEAGSDLASLQTSAVEAGDEYIISGQKTFTSSADRTSHIWLAVRTDREAPRHKGISVFIVDMKTPGISAKPFCDIMARFDFNDLFFDNACVPKDCMIGPKNGGWSIMQDALNEERRGFGAGINNIAICKRYLDYLVDYAKEHGLLDIPQVLDSLSRISIEIEVGRSLAYAAAWEACQTAIAVRATSVGRVFNAHLMQHVANTAMNIVGLYGQLSQDSKWALWSGEICNLYLDAPSETIGAGTTEVMRNTVATVILGLPRW